MALGDPLTAVEVLHEHQAAGTHPAGSEGAVQANGDLVVTEPGGATRTYADGTWDAWGAGLVCAFRTPDPACPRCHPQAQVTSPAPAA